MILIIFQSCKVKIIYPEIYDVVKFELQNENYSKVLNILEASDISKLKQTDWYYYTKGLSLYKLNPKINTRESISLLKISNKFKDSYYTCYYLGKMYFEICDYKKALKYFEKANLLENDIEVIPEKMTSQLWILYIQTIIREREKVLSILKSCDANNLFYIF